MRVPKARRGTVQAKSKRSSAACQPGSANRLNRQLRQANLPLSDQCEATCDQLSDQEFVSEPTTAEIESQDLALSSLNARSPSCRHPGFEHDSVRLAAMYLTALCLGRGIAEGAREAGDRRSSGSGDSCAIVRPGGSIFDLPIFEPLRAG